MRTLLSLGGMSLVVRPPFRRLPDEVSPTGIVASAWEADIICRSDAEANALRAMASHNLRRSVGWQLRGAGYGDVAASGDLIGRTTTVRFTVERDDYEPGRRGWYRALTIRLHEQVAP